jgi:hypothetical protein
MRMCGLDVYDSGHFIIKKDKANSIERTQCKAIRSLPTHPEVESDGIICPGSRL